MHRREFFVEQAVSIHVLVVDEADALDAAADSARHALVDDATGGDGNRLQSRRAGPVDRRRRRRHGQPGLQRALARDIHAGVALRVAAAHNDVFDLGRIDTGASDGVADDVGAEGLPGRVIERTLVRLANRGPRSRYDSGMSHG